MTERGGTVSKLTLAAAGVLVVVGAGAYVVSGFASATALIPAAFGVLFALLALMARRTPREYESLAAVAVLAALGVLGSTRAMPEKINMLQGEPVDSPVAVASQSLMLVVSLVLLVAAAWYLWRTGDGDADGSRPRD